LPKINAFKKYYLRNPAGTKRFVNVYITFTIAFRIGSECPFIERLVLVKNVFLTNSKRYVNVYR